jgi:signal transduction histidine kinase
MVALAGLAQRTQDLNNIACSFECSAPVLLTSNAAATHLFRITQEAIHNAIEHGKAAHIVVALAHHDALSLTIRDDGIGIPPEKQRTPGSGLRLMAYRARIIGATFSIASAAPTGTLVRIDLPPSS